MSKTITRIDWWNRDRNGVRLAIARKTLSAQTAKTDLRCFSSATEKAKADPCIQVHYLFMQNTVL
ncbi:hypothetical protein T4B_3764 [Trichinella pseudospiralis]|uniref:Uncharacterized protein n=1 Tax=Trichinella pseudospiralis TaxID=6337 RepID=A0A0V1GD66_TRIPS|nr:hypothetical protein T4B_3764 [Trichinella pseudospiralis]